MPQPDKRASRANSAEMSPGAYKRARELRGTQRAIAEQLGVHPITIAKREGGAADAPITREAWLALLSLPKKTPSRKKE